MKIEYLLLSFVTSYQIQAKYILPLNVLNANSLMDYFGLPSPLNFNMISKDWCTMFH
jgi:hypothetical protein